MQPGYVESELKFHEFHTKHYQFQFLQCNSHTNGSAVIRSMWRQCMDGPDGVRVGYLFVLQ